MDPIRPTNDLRTTHCNANLNGINYHYLLALPPGGTYRSTIFLIHGWPDLSLGFRHLIPLLLHLSYRVVCPDMIGYGGTEAPRTPPASVELYSFKRAAEDIKELARQLGASRLILGGHDWGGAIAYRIALWFPKLISHIFTICTPYHPPSKSFTRLEDIVTSRLPNFGYQLQLASGIVEEKIQTKNQIKQLLNGIYGGKGGNGEVGFDVREGILFDNLPKLKRSMLIDEDVLEYYADQYSTHGIHSTLNWYRNREQNFRDELSLKRKIINIPVLFIQATKDEALPPAMSEGMEKWIPNLTRKTVTTGHWALWEKPEMVCGIVAEWLRPVDGGLRSFL